MPEDNLTPQPATPVTPTPGSNPSTSAPRAPATQQAQVAQTQTQAAPVRVNVEPAAMPPPTQPIQSAPSPAVATPVVQGEVIQGAPVKPGDKPEVAPQVAPAKATSAVEKKPAAKSDMPPKGKRPSGEDLDGEEELFSAIGYISFLCVFPLLGRRDSEYAQHHGRQGLVLFLIFFFLYMIAAFSTPLLAIVTVMNLAVIIGGFILAIKGEWFKIPGIYDLSLKIKQTQQGIKDQTLEDQPVQENKISTEKEN